MARRRSYGRRGVRRAPLRKFVWARTSGGVTTQDDSPNAYGVDLLGPFQEEYGSQLLGATVVRIRGIMFPRFPGIGEIENVGGAAGVIVENDRILTEAPAEREFYSPFNRVHDDWLAWMPFFQVGAAEGTAATSFNGGSEYNVDVKSSRKIEELGQGLHLWVGRDLNMGGNPGQQIDLWFSLSIGLKLA